MGFCTGLSPARPTTGLLAKLTSGKMIKRAVRVVKESDILYDQAIREWRAPSFANDEAW